MRVRVNFLRRLWFRGTRRVENILLDLRWLVGGAWEVGINFRVAGWRKSIFLEGEHTFFTIQHVFLPPVFQALLVDRGVLGPGVNIVMQVVQAPAQGGQRHEFPYIHHDTQITHGIVQGGEQGDTLGVIEPIFEFPAEASRP